MKYFEDSVISRRLRYPASHELTAQAIVEFAGEWDPQPFHTDPEAAEKSYFGGLVASTVHLFAIANRLCHSDPEPWAAVSSLGLREMNNHAPARPGDRLVAYATCLDKRPSRSKPDLGIVEYRVELVNQRDEPVFSFVNAALHRRRPRPD